MRFSKTIASLVGLVVGVAGAASGFAAWLALTQMPKPRFDDTRVETSPAFAELWEKLKARSRLELIFTQERARIPLDIGADMLELFREFEEQGDVSLAHPEPALRAYAAFWFVERGEIPYERFADLMMDESSLELAFALDGQQRASVAELTLALVCRAAAANEGEARHFIKHLSRDWSRLAARARLQECPQESFAAKETFQSKRASPKNARRAKIWQRLDGLMKRPLLAMQEFLGRES